jgi:hypothetical protein
MKLTNFNLTPVVVVATMALAATPAFAQQRDHSRSSEGRAAARSGDSRRSETPRAQPPARRAEPQQQQRAEAPRAEAPRATPRGEPQRPVQGAATPRAEAPRRVEVPRADGRRVEPRAEVVAPRAIPRGQAVPRAQVIVPRGERGVVVAPRVYAPRAYGYYGYGGGYGYRPYVFRPRTRLAFGIYLGYGVPYAYSYAYPVPVYGYGAPSAPVYITPSSTMYGGLSLEITPSDAQVFVDGQYVGLVRDFDGATAPLNLTAGQHRLELSAPGYEPLALDVNVVPGQLVPYRGDMQPAR